MIQKPIDNPTEKGSLHPRNRHRSLYDFDQLISVCKELAAFVLINKFKNQSIDFANPEAVKTLNKALLEHFYGVSNWDIPKGYLCPAIPGRADYIHNMADLLKSCNGGIIPQGKSVMVLDIGVGANCVYPIIGHKEYGWHFVGSDIDIVAINSAKKITASNPTLAGAIECRHQTSSKVIFNGIVKSAEVFDISICNPPFHSSLAEASSGTRRKLENLGYKNTAKPILNFGGQNAELWCHGGEEEFLRRMIEQSAQIPAKVLWFSTLVSKKINLPGVYKALRKAEALEVKTIEMAQGQKSSRIVCWTFQDEAKQKMWREKRWKVGSEVPQRHDGTRNH